MREVVTRCGFLGACARRDDLAVGTHDLQRQNIIAHGAVAHGIGARRAGGRHAADGGVRAGIDRKEQALIAQMFVERLAGDARFDDAIEIVAMHGEDTVHLAQIDADATRRRVDLPFKRGAGAERNHRDAPLGADPHHVLNVQGRLRHHHRVGRLRRQPGGGMGVLLAHRPAR